MDHTAALPALIESRDFFRLSGGSAETPPPLPTCDVIPNHTYPPIQRFIETGVGDFMVPNDPSLSIQAALALVLVAKIVTGTATVSTETYIDRARLIEVFGTTDPAELQRRFVAHGLAVGDHAIPATEPV